MMSALAVVGARGVGKTTLVKHVCADERVRSHFARIKRFQWWEVEHKGWQPGQTESEWLEDPYPVDESAWATLLASSKLLFTCHARTLRTTEEPVVLRPLPEEAFWYFFKAFAFGGTDPRDHPRITAVARDIARQLQCTFVDARLLRANFDARLWRRVRDAIVRCQRHPRFSLYDDVMLDVLTIRGWRLMPAGYGESRPSFSVPTLQDVIRSYLFFFCFWTWWHSYGGNLARPLLQGHTVQGYLVRRMSMEFARDVVVPAALSEILGRIFSFLIDNFPRPSSAGARDAHRRQLEQLLGIIGSAVEEAEGRHITNLHLLNQLKSRGGRPRRRRNKRRRRRIRGGENHGQAQLRSLLAVQRRQACTPDPARRPRRGWPPSSRIWRA
ncbi:hypothetical protein PR202_gb14267 [Eleusine coracana subsp. coracana]|uniref:Uncharacterized protein n=1 Tax=Eleusine coracana subsp. coracana TaxID=191504 RepID=A0AAV5EU35_ELECO|nr:hypothetical protein PR202_gb14267 [Eleusine coracana subsp. coracana]